MEISIHGRNVSITPRLQSYVERKVERLDRYLPNIHTVQVDLSKENTSEGDQAIAQLTLRHARGTILRAEERTGDIFASVDLVVDKMYRQIEKFKGRRRRRNKNANVVEEFANYETAIELDEEDFEEGKIKRRKQFELLPMTEEEAIEQMELLGHDFFIFLHGQTGQVNVLYRRSGDKDYGVIVPLID